MNRFLFATVGAAAMVSGAFAQTLYTTSFESPFTPGAINGQQGWQASSSAPAITTSTGGVTPHTGTQMLSMPMVAAGGGRYAWTDLTAAFNNRTPGNDLITASVWFWVPSTVTDNTEFGFSAFTDDGLGTDGEVLEVEANVNTGTILLYDASSTAINSNVTFTRDAWNRLDLVLNYQTGVYGGRLNGSDIGVTSTFNNAFGVIDIDLNNYRTTGTQTGGAFFDDYSVTATTVPEPATIAGLGIAALALIRRRRKA